LDVVQRIRERVCVVFGRDARSADALERAVQDPEDGSRVQELAAALEWYARRDQGFAAELASWVLQYGSPGGSAAQRVRAGRDAYVAGRDIGIVMVQPPPASERSPETGSEG
jgi:hypothetical protein